MRITEAFAAGQVKSYAIIGNFFRVASLSGVQAGSLDVVFFRNGQRQNIDLDNVDAGTWARVPLNEAYDRVEVSSTEAQVVSFTSNRGDVGSERIVGEVSVISGEQARTEAGIAYSAQLGVISAATEYPILQIFNPVGSGKNVYLNRIQYQGPAGYTIGAGMYNTLMILSGGIPGNKLNGGPPCVALTQIESTPAVGAILSYMFTFMCSGYTLDHVLTEPIVCGPGTGFFMYGGGINATLRVNFQFYELPL